MRPPFNVRLFLFAALSALVFAGLIAAAALISGQTLKEGGDPRPALVVIWLFASLGAFAAWKEIGKAFWRAPASLAEEIRILAEDSRRRLAPPASSSLSAIAEAVNALAARHQELADGIAAEIARARKGLEAERNRLATLMAELRQSVIVCNADGRILLYNQQAQALFVGSAVGLGRSLYAVLDRALIAHAVEQAKRRAAAGEAPSAEFVIAAAARLLRVQLAPVAAEGDLPAPASNDRPAGFVLLLADITDAFAAEQERDALIGRLTEGSRGPLGNIRAAIETLTAYPDMESADRQRFLQVIENDTACLAASLRDAASSHARLLATRWPLEDMRGADLVAAAAERMAARSALAVSVEAVDASLWLQIESYSFLQVLCYLGSRLRDEYAVERVFLALSAEGGHACLDLAWQGTAISTETVMGWEIDAMRVGGEETPLSVREVMERCKGEVWFQRKRAAHRAYFRFLLPLARIQAVAPEAAPPSAAGSRPEFYDFDLFSWPEERRALDDCALADLAYTVFDTETTGLEPSKGDEIIQIGAIRIVNRRLLLHENFDQLVNPRRPLAAAAEKIHGISAAMLAGQPLIAEVLPQFRAFCADTVLLAHNAAFDMRFLQIKEESCGVSFDLPVLDTLLLSALIHPNQESHRLEAIAGRLGVNIVSRHTALGDAQVTGEIFLKMLPLLAAKGINTLGEARRAARKTYYARIAY